MDGDRRAFIECECKSTRVTFPTDKPAYSYECFCVDCYQKACHFSGGRPLPDVLSSHGGIGKKPVLLSYWPAKLVVSGRDNLAFYKLREGADSTSCVAKCCNSLLFVDHWAYEGRIVLTTPEFRPFQNSAPSEPPEMMVHMRDWPREQMLAYRKSAGFESLPGMWRSHGEVHFDGQPDREYRKRNLERVWAVFESASEGQTFAELLSAAGGKVDIVGLPELSNSARFASAE